MSQNAVDNGQNGDGPQGVAKAPVRGRGGPQLSPDAFAPSGRAPSLQRQPILRRGQMFSARALASGAIGAGRVAGKGAKLALKQGLVVGRNAAATADSAMRTARAAFKARAETPPDVLTELAAASHGRTISNRIEALGDLDAEEVAFIRDFAMSESRPHQPGSELVVEREHAPRPAFITNGWACRSRILSGGRRQVIGFLLPGDAIGLRGAAEPFAITSVTALTPVATVDAGELVLRLDRSNRFPGLERALQRVETQEKDFLINQVTRLGFMEPHERLSDLLRELKWRMQQAGLANDNVVPLPIDQRTLGSALGLKDAHLKSAMRRLAKNEDLRWIRNGVSLPDREWPDPAHGGFRPPPPSRTLRAMHQPRIVAGGSVSLS